VQQYNIISRAVNAISLAIVAVGQQFQVPVTILAMWGTFGGYILPMPACVRQAFGPLKPVTPNVWACRAQHISAVSFAEAYGVALTNMLMTVGKIDFSTTHC
jgi:hypothetical protein